MPAPLRWCLLTLTFKDLLVLGDRQRVRPDTQLLPEDFPKFLELPDRGLAVSGVKMRPHQLPVRLFVRRVDLEDPVPHARTPQDVQVGLSQNASPVLAPGLGAFVGQEIIGIELGRLAEGFRVTGGDGPRARRFEGLNVGRNLPRRPQLDRSGPDGDGLFATERSPGEMDRLPNVRTAGIGAKTGPKRLDDLFSSQAIPGRKSQELDQ